MRFLAESQPVLSQSLSLSTSHLPGFQIKPCHSTSLSLSQALIFYSSYVNPHFHILSYAWFSNKTVPLNLAFTFTQPHFYSQNISTSGFQIQPCHSTWFSNKTLSLNLAFTFTQLSILSYENLLQDETLARKKPFMQNILECCQYLVYIWVVVGTRVENCEDQREWLMGVWTPRQDPSIVLYCTSAV